MGYYVLTTGTDKNGLGHKEADEYLCGDFSDKEFVLKIAKENHVDALVSGCNDFAYLSTAYAGEKLNLPCHDSYETALVIHHKDKFRNLLSSLNIKTPKIFKCENASNIADIMKKMSFPVLVKPVDLTGGKGVCVCNSLEQIYSAFESAVRVTREKYVIIEEFVKGTNHAASVLLKNFKVVCSVFDDEQYFKNQYLVQGASMPSALVSCAAVFTLINDIEKVAAKLQLADGLFHVQFIIDESGYPVMIDPCRRCPGDLYVLLSKYTCGIDYPSEIVKAECGIPLQNSYPQNHNFIARECIMADKNGIIKKIFIDEKIRQFIIDKIIWGKLGDKITDFMKYKAGIIIMQFPDFITMQNILKDFHSLVKIETKNMQSE